MTLNRVWLTTLTFTLLGSVAMAQGGRGGRGAAIGIPSVTPSQSTALARLSEEVAS